MADYFSDLVQQGATGTDDPQRAGLADLLRSALGIGSAQAASLPTAGGDVPPMASAAIPQRQPPQLSSGLPGNTLAMLSGSPQIQAPGGGDISDYVPLIGPNRGTPWTKGQLAGSAGDPASMMDNGQSAVPPWIPRNSNGQPYSPDLASGAGNVDPAVIRGFAQANVGGGGPQIAQGDNGQPFVPPQAGGAGPPMRQMAPAPMPPMPAPQMTTPGMPAPQPGPAAAAAPQMGGGNPDIMRMIAQQIQGQHGGNSDFYNGLLRFGLATMAAGGKPMATTLGAIGEGGTAALDAQQKQRELDLKALLGGAQASNLLSETGLRNFQIAGRNEALNGAQPSVFGGAGAPVSAAPVAAPGQTALSRTTPNVTAASDLPIQARAFLDTIAGPESGGKYNVRYTPDGGVPFDSFDKHPNIPEKGPQGKSTAAGRYQIVKSTYDDVAPKLGATDFAPETQDHLGWQIAQDAFKQQTGGDLLGALQSGDPQALQSVQQAMRKSGQWGTANMANYQANLQKYTQVAQAGGGSAPLPNGLGGGGAEPPNAALPGAAPQPGGAAASIDPDMALAQARRAWALGDTATQQYWQKLAEPQPGFTWARGPKGAVQVPIAGGPADPGYVGNKAGAEKQAGVGPQIQIDQASQAARAQRQMEVDRYKAGLETDPNAITGSTAPGNSGPGFTEPLPTPHGTTIPPLADAAPIVGSTKYLEARQGGKGGWAETENDWSKALGSSKIAEQRALAIAEAMKKTETGALTTDFADVNAHLKAVGLPQLGSTDPAEVQKILKNNFGAVLEQLKSFTQRPAAAEVVMASKNFANPDLQPEANLSIIGQAVGALRWENALQNDFAQAKRYGWRDPQDFQRAWAQANPVQSFVDQAEKEIGPLKGMANPLDPGTKADAQRAMQLGVPKDEIMRRLRANGFDTRGF